MGGSKREEGMSGGRDRLDWITRTRREGERRRKKRLMRRIESKRGQKRGQVGLRRSQMAFERRKRRRCIFEDDLKSLNFMLDGRNSSFLSGKGLGVGVDRKVGGLKKRVRREPRGEKKRGGIVGVLEGEFAVFGL